MRVLAMLAAVLLMASPAAAQVASHFSHGPSIPFFTVEFDSAGDATSGMLSAGAGYSFNLNYLPSADGAWRYMTIGVPVFLSVPSGDLNLAAGLTLGTLNNLVAVGAAVDLARVGDGPDSGVLVGDVSKENLKVLVAFGFNFGSGSPPPGARLVAAAPAQPPPNYVSFSR